MTPSATTLHTPHPENMEDASKSRARKATPKDKMTVQKVQQQVDDIQDTPKQEKVPGVYCFTSMVQDKVDGDVQAKILDILTTLPLKEIIGTSPNLQNRFADLTRTWHKYMTTTVTTESMDGTCSTESAYIKEFYSDKDFGKDTEETVDSTPTCLIVHSPNSEKKEVLLQYSLAMEIATSPLLAKTTTHGEDSPNLDAPIAPDSSLNDCYNVTTQGDKCKDNSNALSQSSSATKSCFTFVKSHHLI